MNVRPGEIAYVVVPAGFSNLLQDKVVTVVGSVKAVDHMQQRVCTPGPGAWLCEFATPFVYKGNEVKRTFILDSWLRPIRWDLGEDETFEWAGKPNETPSKSK